MNVNKKRISRKKGPVVSKKVVSDGINFQSGLEAYMYKALKKSNIETSYEGEKFDLMSSFNLENKCYEKQSNGKGDFKNRGESLVRGIIYTPDFVGYDYIIECKGRANESFPIRWKLFKSHLRIIGDTRALYKPQNQKECDLVVELILKNRKNGI